MGNYINSVLGKVFSISLTRICRILNFGVVSLVFRSTEIFWSTKEKWRISETHNVLDKFNPIDKYYNSTIQLPVDGLLTKITCFNSSFVMFGNFFL